MSRRALSWAVVILAVVLGAFVVRDYLFEVSARGIGAVSFPQGEVVVDVAVSDAERRAGLAGRESLPPDAGMLFVYRDARPRRFTMEGMLFDLDIITLSTAGVVTGVQTRAAGEAAFDTAPARYVLEVGSGWAAAHGVAAGTKASFLPRQGGAGGQ